MIAPPPPPMTRNGMSRRGWMNVQVPSIHLFCPGRRTSSLSRETDLPLTAPPPAHVGWNQGIPGPAERYNLSGVSWAYRWDKPGTPHPGGAQVLWTTKFIDCLYQANMPTKQQLGTWACRFTLTGKSTRGGFSQLTLGGGNQGKNALLSQQCWLQLSATLCYKVATFLIMYLVTFQEIKFAERTANSSFIFCTFSLRSSSSFWRNLQRLEDSRRRPEGLKSIALVWRKHRLEQQHTVIYLVQKQRGLMTL